jgi:hypothetical protein
MDVNASSRITAAAGAAHQPPPRSLGRARERASFGQADALNQQLAQTPDSRPAAVEKARNQVHLAQYPPPEAVDRIARLLAINLKPDDRAANGESP